MVKRLIINTLQRFGYRLHKITPPEPMEMHKALSWIKNQGVKVHTLLDVGASNGCWSRDCMEVFKEQKYVLYEPQPVHHADLASFQSEFIEQVMLELKAVGEKEAMIKFDASDPFGGSIASEKSGDSVIEVEMTSLDVSSRQLNLDQPYLIKLDTHGFEKAIFEGAEQVLKQAEVLIIESYNHRIEPETMTFWEQTQFLADRGFRPVYIVDVLNRKYDHSLWQMDIIYLKEEWGGFKYNRYQ
ncbi:MAG: FkbM family methyltransferase [Opitutales bacterium]|nr:FkbM family methyltransferase [Opitutales bacterium]